MTKAIVTLTVSVPLASDFADLEPDEAAESVASLINGTSFGKYKAQVTHLSVDGRVREADPIDEMRRKSFRRDAVLARAIGCIRSCRTELRMCREKDGAGPYDPTLKHEIDFLLSGTSVLVSDVAVREADDRAAKLFAEGERDAARNDLEECQEHLRVANITCDEALAEVTEMRTLLERMVARHRRYNGAALVCNHCGESTGWDGTGEIPHGEGCTYVAAKAILDKA